MSSVVIVGRTGVEGTIDGIDSDDWMSGATTIQLPCIVVSTVSMISEIVGSYRSPKDAVELIPAAS